MCFVSMMKNFTCDCSLSSRPPRRTLPNSSVGLIFQRTDSANVSVSAAQQIGK